MPVQLGRNPYLQVILVLVLAALLDHLTGPTVSAAAFYIFPVGLAGWRLGGRAAAIVVAAAVVLNASTLWLEMHTPDAALIASQALHTIVYAAVALLVTRLQREQRLLQEQRDRVERLNLQMAAEMQAARNLQEILFVPPAPHPRVEIATFAATARILGGDVLDVSYSADGRVLAVIVADVSGKGSPAALATAVLLGILEDCPARYRSPASALAYLNGRLATRLSEEMFVTALYLLLDLETGVVTWASAGHDRPLLLRSPAAAGASDESDPQSDMALAILPESTYHDHVLQLDHREGLFCYTDGLPDLRRLDGERAGIERLQEAITKSAALPCAELIPAVLRRTSGQDVDALCAAGLDDDITIIALRRR